MGSKTGIEWTDATWNPIIGCSRVSEGCRNCYAERHAGRFGGGKETVYSGLTKIVNGLPVWSGAIRETKQLLQPLRWKPGRPIYDAKTGARVGRDVSKSLRIFVNSMSDLFHENVTDEMRDRIFAVMALCPQHTFQVLTKRPERMLAYLQQVSDEKDMQRWVNAILELDTLPKPYDAEKVGGLIEQMEWPLPNVWLGVSVENQAAADERIPLLLQTPAAKRFLSCEPLLGSVLLRYLHSVAHDGLEVDALSGFQFPEGCNEPRLCEQIDWVICGGESGPGARAMHPDWARGLRDQCQATGVPFFFKQWGEYEPVSDDSAGPHVAEIGGQKYLKCGKKAAGSLLDGVEWKEVPRRRHD
jgi:protein gp37